jgi:hypothetical protein
MRITEVTNRPIRARSFSGRGQVRKNWSQLCESIPDFRVELLRFAVFGEEEWGEWIWRGTKEDGTALEERGVMIIGIRGGQIAWGACTSRKPKEKVLTSQRPCDAWRVGSEFRHQKLALARKLASRRRDSSQPAGSVGAGVDWSLALIQGLVMFVAPGRILLAVASAALSCRVNGAVFCMGGAGPPGFHLEHGQAVVASRNDHGDSHPHCGVPRRARIDPHKRLTWRLGGGLLAILASSVYLSVVMTKRARKVHSPAPAGTGGERRAAPKGR